MLWVVALRRLDSDQFGGLAVFTAVGVPIRARAQHLPFRSHRIDVPLEVAPVKDHAHKARVHQLLRRDVLLK
jgi:hypothetical protein